MTEQADLSDSVKAIEGLARNCGLAGREVARLSAAREAIVTENSGLRREVLRQGCADTPAPRR